MARLPRFEFRGITHLVTVSGYQGGHVLYEPHIFRRFPENPRGHALAAEYFEGLLWESCEQYDASVHAYVLEPNTAQIVIQTHGAPLSWIIHDLLARFSMYLAAQHRTPKGKRSFPRRYRAQIVQPAKLPYAVRYVQQRATVTQMCRRPFNHPFSSNLIYCGRKPKPASFVTSAMQKALAPLGYLGPNAYYEFMAASDSPSIAHMLSRPIIGEPGFVKFVRARCRESRRMPCERVPSPDEILRRISDTLLHTDFRVASSSTHLGALARALVAWYAMRTGAARIGAVGRWFGVTGSDLRYLIRRHRRKHPQYFSVATSDLFPDLDTTPPIRPTLPVPLKNPESASRAPNATHPSAS